MLVFKQMFCRHSLIQDIRMVPISYNSSEARLFGIGCSKCGKHWNSWTNRLNKRYHNQDIISKIEKCIRIIKGD